MHLTTVRPFVILIVCRIRSINAVGVDIAPFSAHPSEEEVLLLPGLPLVNRAGENPAPGLWTFEVETPRAFSSVLKNDSPSATIDYVHPGACACLLLIQKICFACWVVIVWFAEIDLLTISDWDRVFHDKSWRRFSDTEIPVKLDLSVSADPTTTK